LALHPSARQAGLLTVALLVAVAACSGDDEREAASDPPESVDLTNDAILDQGGDAEPVPLDTYPWLVSLGGTCGGALIASNAILTAAHCIDNNGNSGNPVAVNTTSQALIDAVDDLGAPSYTWIHPDYEAVDPEFDVAVIVYDDADAIPRNLLTPARVGPPASEPSALSILLRGCPHSPGPSHSTRDRQRGGLQVRL